MLLLLLTTGCKQKAPETPADVHGVDYTQVEVPAFSADSAYAYVEAQLAFGNRIPGSKGWQQCAQWLASRMARWCDTVTVQDFQATLWDQSTVPGKNIVASLRPGLEKRILLAAHWDSRSWADHDPDDDLHHSPVPGANDGASGVALLMEMARVMSQKVPEGVGVDFLFFDVEDQGAPEWSDVYDEDTWCKGSQHWVRQRHVPFYTAVYGILFDMVGTQHPRFTREQISRNYAPGLVGKLWDAAKVLGYGDIFVDLNTDPILDDHYYVNRLSGIPMVDIVQNSGTTSFFEHWHTTTDDLQAVSAESLRIVAEVTMKVIYGDYPGKQGMKGSEKD
ncbi:MAG: M28 family peptidase [Bacteroidales bacterium]|nr:M28 family peptidase [Bacteroidales bacterium]